jgi:SAM-dependent methyltransferase
MSDHAHWDAVYRAKGPDQHSWFQAEALLSKRLIGRVAPERDAAIVDIGAGASTLVDGLLGGGYHAITVLDISEAALAVAQQRLGDKGQPVTWQVRDVTRADLEPASFDIWHDRAVFHFLIDPAVRAAYVAQVRRALRPGGHVIMATFADDGPTHCSGLPVVRYSAEQLHAELGPGFPLVESHRELHTTPSRAQQVFTYIVCRYTGAQ